LDNAFVSIALVGCGGAQLGRRADQWNNQRRPQMGIRQDASMVVAFLFVTPLAKSESGCGAPEAQEKWEGRW